MEMHAQYSQDISTIIIDKDNLDGFENETFLTLLQNSIYKGCKNISIDLSNVKFVASMGIGILIRAYKLCRNKNIVFKITNAKSTVLNELNHLRLTEIFKIN
jgi:anti-anti-sigma factor